MWFPQQPAAPPAALCPIPRRDRRRCAYLTDCEEARSCHPEDTATECVRVVLPKQVGAVRTAAITWSRRGLFIVKPPDFACRVHGAAQVPLARPQKGLKPVRMG